MKNNKIYFPNLNGLRFIAAFVVIIHHIEQIKSGFDITNIWDFNSIKIIGKLGVILFFVLSGFLITYLLLAEERIKNEISIRKFYMRRVLRIWPLYYLIILLALFVLPHFAVFDLPNYDKSFINSNFSTIVLLYLLIIPNLVLSNYGGVPYASHTWSIGTEEQFYLVWPILMKFVRIKKINLMLVVIFGYLILKIIVSPTFGWNGHYAMIFSQFLKTFPIDCMAIGGIYSVLLFNKSEWLKYLFRKDLFYISILLVLVFIFLGVRIPYFHYEFYAVFFGIIILNFAANKKLNISLENKFINYLGKISYGLYMFHPLAIVISIKLCLYFKFSHYFIYLFSIVITILIATLSYEYFEKFFLKYKNQFARILSGN